MVCLPLDVIMLISLKLSDVVARLYSLVALSDPVYGSIITLLSKWVLYFFTPVHGADDD